MAWLANNTNIPKSVEFYLPLSVDVSVEYELNTPPPPPGSAPLLIIHPSAYFGVNSHSHKNSAAEIRHPFCNTSCNQHHTSQSPDKNVNNIQGNMSLVYTNQQIHDLFAAAAANRSRPEHCRNLNCAEWMLATAESANEPGSLNPDNDKISANYLHLFSKAYKKAGATSSAGSALSNASRSRSTVKERPQHKQYGHSLDGWRRTPSCEALHGKWASESLQRIKVGANEAHMNNEHCTNIPRSGEESRSAYFHSLAAKHGTFQPSASSRLNSLHLEGSNASLCCRPNSNGMQDSIMNSSGRDKCLYQYQLPHGYVAGVMDCTALNHCPCACVMCQKKQFWIAE